ncbi:uncharacterized protein J7T54_007393 [Emericellopsis cladophorae]|uniref:ubiquitinyl hydrolase 1 n=1 Tax=Emericellopsis cladophorae TaxID=2686198 RepID=A0A9Q0BAD3_9HYPO|nr:uncharacterized protein J7T54_007393 [Emericellopsis cladophorae]KAI6777666.1 hypothetical protein J7T54_007393 [Emericellopsis cladophorae]
MFLPPKVPVKSDYTPQNEHFLLCTTLESLEAFRSMNPDRRHGTIDTAITMLRRMQDTHVSAAGQYVVDKSALVRAIRQLDNHGILLSAAEDDILVEVFEVSPVNQHVISTKGRLRRAFPASGVCLQHDVLQDPSFREAFASTVAKMSQQRVKGTQPKAKKAAHMHDEDRDTTHPRMVTEFLISVLAPLGRTATTSPIWKNTRDEVLYYSSLQPWRRSPLWLVIRVALQLVFSRFHPERPGDSYKEFMIFAMAKILSKTHHYEFHSELLLAMSSKIRQRLLKIDRVSNAIRDFARVVLVKTDRILEDRWSRIQGLDSLSPPPSELIGQNIIKDTLGCMSRLDEFIDSLGTRRLDQSRIDLEPGFKLKKGDNHALPSLHATSGDQLTFELMAFETWVASSFSSWLDTHRSDAATIGRLRELIERYHNLAEPEYDSDPESTSLMILTILELWVGCDEASLSAIPLLRDYDPGIPSELFQNLLLPFRHQMRRLSTIEEYLVDRAVRSIHPSADVLGAFGTQNCFSARYYQLSSEHQELKARIESWAAQCRETKEAEFQNKKAQCRSLMSQYESTNCQMVTEWSEWDDCYIEKHYGSRCTRCGYLREAEAMNIHIHEWPLPPIPLEASSTVFELLVPPSFGHWRDVTVFLQSEVLGSAYRSYEVPRSEHTPASYEALSAFFRPFGAGQRIMALSENKPHAVTHRKAKRVGRVTERDVCLQNALHYRYYDRRAGSFVQNLCSGEKVQEKCTYKLHTESSSLQKFLRRGPGHPSGPSPNTVIASQSTCPQGMPLGDFKALCSIPLGYSIQWQNILVQLQAPSMNLNTTEATYTLLQCAHQAGPRGNCGVLRESFLKRARQISMHWIEDLCEKRWQRLSYRTYPLLAEMIVDQADESLDRVVNRQWPAYQAFSSWKRVSSTYDNWLTIDAATVGAKELLIVHFNLLDGELLVNGVPLSRLPGEYENHIMYRVLFGQTAIEVMPTTVPGMRFSAKNGIAGHTRHRLFQRDAYVQPPELKGVDHHLLARDDIRSSTFRVAQFGAEKYSMLYDMVYPARDQWKGSESSNRAAAISKIMYSTEVRPLFNVPQELDAHIWRFLAKHEVMESGSQPLDVSGPGYDARWLSGGGSYIAQNFIKLHLLISRQRESVNKFRLTMWLSSLAYAADADMPMLYVLSTFRLPSMERVVPPEAQGFKLSRGDCVSPSELGHAVQQHCVSLHQSPEASVPQIHGEKRRRHSQRQQELFRQNQKAPRKRLVGALASQWPCRTLDRSIMEAKQDGWSQYYHTGNAVAAAESLFKTWDDNRLLRQYINELVSLVSLSSHQWHMEPPSLPLSNSDSHRTRRFVTVDDLFTGPAPEPRHMVHPDMACLLEQKEDTLDTRSRLLRLIADLESEASSTYEQLYVASLRTSLQSFGEGNKIFELREPVVAIRSLLKNQQISHRDHVDRVYSGLLDAVGFSADEVGGRMKQWPRLSPALFLQQLSRTRWHGLSEGWKRSIVQYALALSFLQQTERRLSMCGNVPDLIKDLSNTGHTNWDPYGHPETLLLEIESGITVREVQEQISQSMRATPAGRNEVMQLNMGEGKSSVIVPMIATALADGHRLVRVIVGKPQANQMLEMLISKLGGLVNRPIFQLPFSRDVQPEASDVAGIQSIFDDCIAEGGVLLVQPEHVLSFKLMALERVIAGKDQVGRSMLQSLEFLNKKTRDIVDESDENFSVKFELIYTLGLQQPIDDSPNRWAYIHDVLDILRIAVPLVYAKLPDSMEVSSRCPGSFPRTRILTEDAETQLMHVVATHICDNGLCGFSASRHTPSIRTAVYKYITHTDLTDTDVSVIEKSSFCSHKSRNILLLLRGLLAHRVLVFVFAQKRWRVDYGLVHDRQPPTRLAVPYMAEDRPRPRSEFSHPEVVILLTCLSYYYGGLTDDDQFEAFRHLCRSDQADMEYQAWVRDANHLPKSFQQLSGLNLEDVFQCTALVFPCFRYAKAAIDYFLSHIVFCKEMKEFPQKLTASGWDLGEMKSLPTTGFSGTNDSRVVLPLSVQQLDLPEQKHTNALVLTHILRPENTLVTIDSQVDTSSMSDAERLLSHVVSLQDPVRVIIDVGAQILELNNLEVAQTWLSMLQGDERTRAVVFFDENDRICVLDRHDTSEPLHTSPYAGQLDACLVFLDEAHTRGTDLKLPQDYRAAVTLGANLTKDRLVQACMRMRELGKGQSVTFCVPHEIEMKIRSRRIRTSSLDVAAILEWAIFETWRDARRSIQVWAMQGKRYRVHERLWSHSRGQDGSSAMSQEEACRFLEDEAQTIEARYRLVMETKAGQDDATDDTIVLRCQEFGALDPRPAMLREEQERELSPETERERQIQRAPPAKPLPHHVHPDILRFVSTGILSDKSAAVMPALMALSKTTAAAHMDLSQCRWELLVSADFARTIQIEDMPPVGAQDCFQRSVQWILTGLPLLSTGFVKSMVVISPYEAQELFPDIMKSETVCLHLYATRPNLGYRPLDSLDLYTVPDRQISPIPQSLILQLNLFAGQLYFDSFEEYTRVSRFLGVGPQGQDPLRQPHAGPTDRMELSCFQKDYVGFFKVMFTKVRRDCESIDKTHMGRLLNDRLLTVDDFTSLS